MPDHNYTTETLTALLEGIQESLNKIETKVTATNGRVKALEMWRMFLLGAWAVITILIPVLYMQVSARVDAFTAAVDNKITAVIERNNDKYFER